jgi:hypothetical protein
VFDALTARRLSRWTGDASKRSTTATRRRTVLRNASACWYAIATRPGSDIDAYDPAGQPLRIRRRLTVDHPPSRTGPNGGVAVRAHVSERPTTRSDACDARRCPTTPARAGLPRRRWPDRVTVSTTDGRLTDLSVPPAPSTTRPANAPARHWATVSRWTTRSTRRRSARRGDSRIGPALH